MIGRGLPGKIPLPAVGFILSPFSLPRLVPWTGKTNSMLDAGRIVIYPSKAQRNVETPEDLP
jgi:hypothetical protein